MPTAIRSAPGRSSHPRRSPDATGARLRFFPFERKPERGAFCFCLSLGLSLAAGCRGPASQGFVVAASETAAPSVARSADKALERRADAFAHYAMGVVEDARGENDQAIAEYEAALKADPANEPLAVELARRYLRANQPEKALRVLDPLSNQPKASGRLLAYLGMARQALGRKEEAETAFKEAIRRDPRALIAYRGLAQLAIEANHPEKALAALDQGAKSPDASAEFLIGLTEQLLDMMETGKTSREQARARAEKWLSRAWALRGENPALFERIAEGWRRAGFPKKAIEAYSELLRRFPPRLSIGEALLRDRLYRLYLQVGDRQGARAQLEAILRINPTNPFVHLMLGSIASEEGEYAKAEESFRKAILLNPDLETAYYQLAGTLLAQNKPEEALEVLGKARSRFKPSFLLEFYTGLAYGAQEKYAEALKRFTAARIHAEVAEPRRLNQFFYFQLGTTYERLGKIDEAAKALKKAIQLAPRYAPALNYLGYTWADRGEHLEEAYELIRRALEVDPTNAAYLDSMGWALYRLKRYKEALEYQLKAVKAAGEEEQDATLYEHLGDIYQALGQKKKAIEAWRKAYQLDPKPEIKAKIDKAKACASSQPGAPQSPQTAAPQPVGKDASQASPQKAPRAEPKSDPG